MRVSGPNRLPVLGSPRAAACGWRAADLELAARAALVVAVALATACGGANSSRTPPADAPRAETAPSRAAPSPEAPAAPSAPAGDVPTVTAPTPPELMEGERFFDANCAHCHGPRATGTEHGPPFLHVIYVPSHHSDAAFQLAAANGVRAHHWQFGDMPPVPGVTPDQVAEIVGYVRWLQRQAGIIE